MPQKLCPFQCGGKMVLLQGAEGPKLIMQDAIDEKAAMRRMVEGSLNRHPKSRYEQCDNPDCNFLAIFPAPARRR